MPTGDPERYARLTREIQREFPDFRIVVKTESWLQRGIHVGLVAVTLGKMRRYMSDYQTTLGQVVYVTPDWTNRCFDRRSVILRHERVHMRQFRDLTPVGMAAIYGVFPMPMGLAYGRAHLEKEAYAESIRATAEIWGRGAVLAPDYRERIVSQFTGPSYGWMWPFRRQVEAWYDRVLETLPDESPDR